MSVKMSEMELAKIYEAYEKIKNLDFSKKEIIEPRGKNVPEGVSYELGNAIALRLKEAGQKYFYVSGDGRISTPQLLHSFIESMLNNGINVVYAGYNNLTPMFEIEREKLRISGVNITASHQPWQYNGFKMVIENAAEEIGAELEKLQEKGNRNTQQKNHAKIYYLQSVLRQDYLNGLENEFKELRKKKSREKILFDALQGPAFSFFSAVAQKLNINFDGFREDIDGYFSLTMGGPSPLLKENFDILKNSVSNLAQYSLAVTTDGDGDRLGAVFHSKLIDFAVLGAVRAVYLAEREKRKFVNERWKNRKVKFVAEYALTSMIENYLRGKNIDVIPVARGRASLTAKIQELGKRGEKVLGGQEIGLHPYNSVGVNDGIEDALLFSEILKSKGRKYLGEMIEEARENVKPHIHEIRVYCKEPERIRNELLNKGYVEKFNDVVCALNDTEAVVHVSNTAKQITINAYSKSSNNLPKDLNKLFREIDDIEGGLEKTLKEQFEIIR